MGRARHSACGGGKTHLVKAVGHGHLAGETLYTPADDLLSHLRAWRASERPSTALAAFLRASRGSDSALRKPRESPHRPAMGGSHCPAMLGFSVAVGGPRALPRCLVRLSYMRPQASEIGRVLVQAFQSLLLCGRRLVELEAWDALEVAQVAGDQG
jgi:hypothetical protein